MKEIIRKLDAYLGILNQQRRKTIEAITEVWMQPCGYKRTGEMPDAEKFVPFDTARDTWGAGKDTHAWFRFSVDVPEGYAPETLRVDVDTDTKTAWNVNNPQFLVYLDGNLLQGLDINHRYFVPGCSGRHEVLLYAYTGNSIETSVLKLKLSRAIPNVEKLWYDLKIPRESLDYLGENSFEYRQILGCIDGALRLLKMHHAPSEEFYDSVNETSDYMDRVFYGKLCNAPRENDPVVIGIGHTHIDCAWLWTLKQTREKVQRSFSTVVELMRQYPEYRFMSSQAFLYQNLKEEAPETYEKIRELIRQGRWECEGAMWVEADCNLTSGESLVRQVLYGKRFFKQEFGVENRVLWLPDVFGYSAALPQILRKSGVEWFVTSKISWNDTNKMPYDTFLWRGIDGTGINTYFLTAQDKKKGKEPENFTTYVGMITPAMVAGTQERYQQKELTNETIITYGYGDGGGGPTADHLEVARRLSKGIPGTPAFRSDFAGNFLSRLEKKIENNPLLPEWNGELYLEYHRGTYTSQANNKKNNRRCEALYLTTEMLCTMDGLLTSAPFPKKELHKGWEMLLTNQFHDIIPGSSIKAVYEQSDRDYLEIKKIAESQLERACRNIAGRISGAHGFVVFNPNPTVGTGIVRIGGKSIRCGRIPPKGYACVGIFRQDNHVRLGKDFCETDVYRLTFDDRMQICSLFDKRCNREVLKNGAVGNELRVYADYPYASWYDAWEWNENSLDRFEVISDVSEIEEVQDGVRAGLKIKRKYGNSSVVQTIWLYDDIDRIDFETDVDWCEKHKMLKTAFDVDVHSARATYEIQYGNIERPTHKNTSWDRAKFEVCGQRFADLSEGNYGVTLLNDCKYGYDIHDGLMTLSLLRSPTYPDPDADQGTHHFTYAVHAHTGALNLPEVYTHAYDLNNPMTAVAVGGEKDAVPTEFALVECDKPNVLCEVIKEAEDSEDLIFRFFECSNSKTAATLRFGFDVEKVVLCDLNENSLKALSIENGTVLLSFGAFEIQTVKVTMKR